MDFSNITNGLQTYIITIIFLSAALGSLIESIKLVVTGIKPNIITYKTYKLFLIIMPYIIGVSLFLLLRFLKQPVDIIQFILASSLSDSSYRILNKSMEIYSLKQEKEK
jgi:ABC-type multidrug transport system permease subunit